MTESRSRPDSSEVGFAISGPWYFLARNDPTIGTKRLEVLISGNSGRSFLGDCGTRQERHDASRGSEQGHKEACKHLRTPFKTRISARTPGDPSLYLSLTTFVKFRDDSDFVIDIIGRMKIWR